MVGFRLFIAAVIIAFVAGCSLREKAPEHSSDPVMKPAAESPKQTKIPNPAKKTETPIPVFSPAPHVFSYKNPLGTSVKERFITPEGYNRIATEDGSFAEFLQNLPLKPDGEKVYYYDGRVKSRDVYLAVVDYTLGDRDLQQCADAVIRLQAEYLYAADQFEKIQYHFVNGFLASFSKWSQGYSITVNGNDVGWKQNSNNDASYESFQRYLDIVYAYASTLSLEKELETKDISDLSIGDVFIRGGSPGHCVIVTDMAVQEFTGEKLFILAQSYMPAQDIQILKCPANKGDSPWYSENFGDSLITPEWTFYSDEIKSWK